MKEANFETFIELELLLSKSLSSDVMVGNTKFPLASISEGEIFDEYIEITSTENTYIGKIKIEIEIESPLCLYNQQANSDSAIPPEYLVLYIDKGERIIQKQVFGNQQVFVTIKYHDNEYETRELLSGEENPEWKARFVINVPLNAYNFIDDVITFELSTCNIIGATTLGSFTLPIKPYIDGLLYSEEITIRNKQGRINGRIYIRIQCMYKNTSNLYNLYKEGSKKKICNNLSDFIGQSLEYVVVVKDLFLSHLKEGSSNDNEKIEREELSKIIPELEIENPKIVEYNGNNKKLSFNEFILWFTQLSIIVFIQYISIE